MERLVKEAMGESEGSVEFETKDSDFEGGDRPHIPYTTENDSVLQLTGKGDVARYRGLLAKVSRYINPIRRELERTLKAQENKRWASDKERGAIDARQLARLATDRNFRKPFKQMVRTETDNVAVQILIDLSGSMGGSRIETARQTAAALAESLKDLGIEFEITGFHTCQDRKVRIPLDVSRRFNRYDERMEYSVFKEFGSYNLTGIELIRSGENNIDPEAVQWAADRLAARREPRKIMLVLSDGYPAASTASSKIMGDQLRLNVKKIAKAGVEVVGIGIESDSVRRFYPDYIIVNSLKELPGKALQKLAKIITRKAA